MTDYPSDWDHMEDKDDFRLFLLDPEKEIDEYERVTGEFLKTLPNAVIQRVQRVQNKRIWEKYFHCSKMLAKIDPPILGEKLLFHGTSDNDPKKIYSCDEGFDLRFSKEGMWGRGNYFAANASYSDGFAFNAGDGMKKMFAAWVLTGRAYHSPQIRKFTKAPYLKETESSSTAVRISYDSVCGTTQGTRVYVTYDNVHAYPAYLITYR